MVKVIFLLLLTMAALGQTSIAPISPPADDKIRAAMETSLAKQRISIQKQAGMSAGAPGSFFTIAWPRPAAVAISTSSDIVPVALLDCQPAPDIELTPIIEDVAKRESIDARVIREVMRKESGFRPCAVSPKGAQGLMQLMPATQQQFGVTDPFNPEQSVAAGGKLLKQLMERYGGNISLALAAYNAGPRRVDAAGGVPPIPETSAYVSDIIKKLPMQ